MHVDQAQIKPDDAAAIGALLGSVKPGDYIALTEYFVESPERDQRIASIRETLGRELHVATTTGYGPRFLHSTGQLHKGGPATGVFMQLTGGGHADVPIPNEKFTFGVLVRAQAIGDFQSLASRKRRAVSIDLGDDVDAGLDTLAKTVKERAGEGDEMTQAQFGVIGLAVMGENLALNIEEHGFSVAVWNRETTVIDAFIAKHAGKKFTGTKTLEELVQAIERPRRIMMMIKAGAPVDMTIDKLMPLLDEGDVVIDGGNSWFKDTQERTAKLEAKKLHFVGSGVSGGEEGARFGPSLMPGGSKESWEAIQPVFEAIAAKSDSGPCVTHVGPDGAGHFVKMVHNGIEYGDMQLIAEAYEMLRKGLGADAERAGGDFRRMEPAVRWSRS